jgi:hypothetical protein
LPRVWPVKAPTFDQKASACWLVLLLLPTLRTRQRQQKTVFHPETRHTKLSSHNTQNKESDEIFGNLYHLLECHPPIQLIN